MPIYAYRCDACGELTEQLAAIEQVADNIICAQCGSEETRRVISSVAYHTSEAAKTAKLDPKYEKMVDRAMQKSAGADEHRLLKKMKPFTAKNTK